MKGTVKILEQHPNAKVLATCWGFDPKRYSDPWVASVNRSTGKPDFSKEVGIYTGTRRSGEAGSLLVYEPIEGAVYMYGQKDYRGGKTSRMYAQYCGGAFTKITQNEAFSILQGVSAERKANDNRSENTLIDVSALDLPFTPYPFQIEDAGQAVRRKRALLGHEMGCGKTFMAILVGMSIPGRKLVICPETLRLNWQRELERTDRVATVEVLYSNREPIFTADWTVIGYKTAVKFAPAVLGEGFTSLFVDEAHKCKAVDNYGRPASQQAKVVMQFAKKIPYVYLLTGTPMPTRNKDLYNELVMLGERDNEKKYDFLDYGKTFCDAKKGQFGWTFDGSCNSVELHTILSAYMVRRLKSEVLPHLTKQRQSVLIEGPLSKEYREIEHRLYHPKPDDTFLALAMTGRRLLSECKAQSAIEFSETLVEADEQVVLATEFDGTLDRLLAHFGENACCIRGGMSDVQKQQSIDAFQSGEKRVCCINLLAAGLGVTLTNAHSMVICDFDWTPANMVQVEDRICRPGQDRHCMIYYIVHRKAVLDDVFVEMITDKSENVDQVVDQAENSVDLVKMRKQGGSQSEYIRRLKDRIEKEQTKQKKTAGKQNPKRADLSF